MKFLHPEILYALAAVIVPIIVHLFNFRKFKKVPFSNVDFLKEVKLETKSKSQLKHILVLISRMLAITALVFAFAQPYIPTDDGLVMSKNNYVQLYIDNSFSMESENENGNLLAIAKAKAEEIVSYYSPTDKFAITTNDFEGRHQRWVNKEEVLDLIDEVSSSPIARPLNEVVIRQSDMTRDPGTTVKDFIISDLQASTTLLDGIASDSLRDLVFVPTLSTAAGNIYIDSLYFNSPVRLTGSPEKVQIKIKHSLAEGLSNQSMKLSIDGQQKAIGSYDIKQELSTDTSLTFSVNKTGWHTGFVEIDDAPVTYDDQLFFSYNIAESVSILEIHQSSADAVYFDRMFANDEQYDYESVASTKVNYSELNDRQLIIVNQLSELSSGLQTELSKFASNGGTVLLIPNDQISLSSYNSLLRTWNAPQLQPKISQAQSASRINLESYIYNGVFDKMPRNLDLPKVQSYYPVIGSSQSYQDKLITFQNGASLLSLVEVGSGRLCLFTTSLDKPSSNLTEHALFVASVLRIAESSQSQTRLYYTIGKDEAILLRNVSISGDEVLNVKASNRDFAFIPQHNSEGGNTRVFVRNQIKDAGVYSILRGDEELAKIAFNYSRAESDLASTKADDLIQQATELGLSAKILSSGAEAISQEVKLLNEGKTYWKTFMIIALIMLALEILLIKFWK